MSLNKKMGDAHEERMAEALGGRKTKGSGNQWHNQADGRHSHYEDEVAFAWDGKSTRGKSLSVKLDDLDKIEEQSHGERPAMGYCFYGNDRLTEYRDFMLIRLEDLAELVHRSRALSRIEALAKDVDAGTQAFEVVGNDGGYQDSNMAFAQEILDLVKG